MSGKGIDTECVSLCDAMNAVPGITTFESCAGHGQDPYMIWFHAEDLGCLPDLLYWFASCHCGFWGWRATVKTDCGRSPVSFVIEGPIGPEAYEQSEEIARLIVEDLC